MSKRMMPADCMLAVDWLQLSIDFANREQHIVDISVPAGSASGSLCI